MLLEYKKVNNSFLIIKKCEKFIKWKEYFINNIYYWNEFEIIFKY